MKRISILVITITFFCAIYAAVGSGNNDVVKRYEFYARPFAVLDSTQAVTDTVAISSDSTVAMVAVDTLTTNVDSINVAVDTLTTNVDSINVTLDTLTTNVDSINVTVDTLTTNIDSINVAVDTLTTNVDSINVAVDPLTTNVDSINVAVDTLTTNVDSINVAVDTFTTNIDSLNVAVDTLTTNIDSINVAVDTLTTNVDSLAVDSAALKSTVPDSLLIGYMPKVLELKYLQPTELSQNELDALRTLYKRECREKWKVPAHGEPYYDATLGELYDTWKLLFTSTPEKTLDLYVDGVAIIQSKIDIETILHKRYDRMLEFRDELMELYDMALSDIDRLNSQIDRTKSKDTLSVAKLRASQVYSYLEITADHMAYTVDTMSKNDCREYILNERKNREYAAFMYPRYKEMLKCGDLNIDMIHLYYFSILAKNRITLDKEVGLSQSERLNNFNEDKDLLLARADEIFNAPDLDLYATHDKTPQTVLEAYSKYNNQIGIALNQAAGLFLDNGNYEEIEKHYASRLQKEGNDPNFRAEVLNGQLRAYAESDVYLDILRREYKDKPSYASAKQIAVRYYRKYAKTKIVQDFENCYAFYKYAIEYYSQGTEDIAVEEKIKTYISAIEILSILKKEKNNRLKYIKEVINLYPEYPEGYYLEALMLYEVGIEQFIKNKDKYKSVPIFIVALDLCNKSKNMLNEYKKIPDSLIKTNDDLENNINKILKECKKYIPSTAEYFRDYQKDVNEYHDKVEKKIKDTIKLYGYSYTFIWIAVNE